MPRLLSALDLATQTSPSAPSAGVRLFGKSLAAQPLLHAVSPNGAEFALQQSLARSRVTWWAPAGTAAVGMGTAVTATGTGTAAGLATTSKHTLSKRVENLVTVAATTAVAGFRGGSACCWRGNAAGEGGFLAVFRGAPATGPSTTGTTGRFFMGFRGSASAPTDVDPSAATNCVGMGYDATDTNLQIMTNDASGAATKTSLGIAKPTTDRANLWELILHAVPNGSSIDWVFSDYSSSWTPTPQTGNIAADLPTSTALLVPFFMASVGGTSSVVGVALMNFYCETDT